MPWEDAQQPLTYAYDRDTLAEARPLRRKHPDAGRAAPRQGPLAQGVAQGRPAAAAAPARQDAGPAAGAAAGGLRRDGRWSPPPAPAACRRWRRTPRCPAGRSSCHDGLSEEDATAEGVVDLVDELLDGDSAASAVLCTHRPVLPTVFDALRCRTSQLEPGGDAGRPPPQGPGRRDRARRALSACSAPRGRSSRPPGRVHVIVVSRPNGRCQPARPCSPPVHRRRRGRSPDSLASSMSAHTQTSGERSEEHFCAAGRPCPGCGRPGPRPRPPVAARTPAATPRRRVLERQRHRGRRRLVDRLPDEQRRGRAAHRGEPRRPGHGGRVRHRRRLREVLRRRDRHLRRLAPDQGRRGRRLRGERCRVHRAPGRHRRADRRRPPRPRRRLPHHRPAHRAVGARLDGHQLERPRPELPRPGDRALRSRAPTPAPTTTWPPT